MYLNSLCPFEITLAFTAVIVWYCRRLSHITKEVGFWKIGVGIGIYSIALAGIHYLRAVFLRRIDELDLSLWSAIAIEFVIAVPLMIAWLYFLWKGIASVEAGGYWCTLEGTAICPNPRCGEPVAAVEGICGACGRRYSVQTLIFAERTTRS